MQGRIEGRVSADGLNYELVQGGKVLRAIPIDEARDDKKLAGTIKKNGWEKL
jgi:hypothetical protein